MKHVFTLVALALMSSGLAQLPDYVPSDGLVAWYPLDGLAHDAGTYELHGVLQGPAVAEDRYGNPNGALSFDGVDDRVSIPHSDLTNPSVLTLSVWFKDSDFSNSDGQQSQLISKREFTGWGNAYEFGIGYPITEFPETPTIYSNFSVNGNHTIFHASESIFENQWHQAVYCHGEDSLFIYLDGEHVLAQISPGPLPTSNELPTWFGGRPGGSGRHFFSGLLDDIGIWNRVLSHEEILALYISEQPISGCTDTAACNYEPTATEDNGSCDHSCCPGPGCCDVGMHWDWELGMCQITNVADTNLDGCVQLNDLLDVLSAYGDCGVLENEVQVISNPNFEIADGIYNQWPELTIALRAAFSDSTGSSNIYRQIKGGEMGLNHSDGKLSFSLKASNGNCFTAAGWVAVETDLTDDDLHSIIARYSRLTGEFSLAIDGEIMVVSAINSGDLADCNLYNGEIGFPSDTAWSLEEIGFYDFVWSEEMVASYADCVPLTSLDMEPAQLILPSGVSIDEVEELLSPYAPITVTGTSGFLPCE